MSRRADLLVDRLDAALARLELIADRLTTEALLTRKDTDDDREDQP